MTEGIYEELVTQLVRENIDNLEKTTFHINTTPIDKEEASATLARHLSFTIKKALDYVRGENQLELQIEIANKIIQFLKEELQNEYFDSDLISLEGEILKAVFSKVDAHFTDINLHLKEITPTTRLTQSALFTGGNRGISLESELKKEILSSNKIDLLVSFIKFHGIRIIESELREFTERGGKLRVITTTYMGASDYKAIKILSQLPNTEVKISYNSGNERLHAKAYLFKRNTGFHTGYIGSSNFSRSALTNGLEWNMKITSKEVSHIIDMFEKTFDSYWQSNDFETFDDSIHHEKLKTSLQKGKIGGGPNRQLTFFDLSPFDFQKEILEKLQAERTVHGRAKNLVVAATGTGKTMISAFDYLRFRQNNPTSKLLFLAHRKEILTQAMMTYRQVLRDQNFGELWVDGQVPTSHEYIFASIQTINNRLDEINLSKEYFDYIVIDECHHLKAKTYRGVLNYFEPKVLLGLTATPERMDGGNIQEDFHDKIAAEIRLPEALNRKLLCPFQYFGVTDSIDLSNVRWEKGRYVASELSSIFTANDRRVNDILKALDKYTNDVHGVKSIGFCVSMAHAKFMAEKFLLAGLKANYLTSENSQNRDQLKAQFQNGEINYLFVVDIFNEGVDIPEIDTVLFLRPTESLTIFLQQLGRGLRLSKDKDCLTVLDFVGNSRPEYDFENKFRALIGKTATTVYKEIEHNFPHLPLGCSIVLEKQAKESILANISSATSFNRRKLIQKIQSFEHQSSLPLTLKNFSEFYHIPLSFIYKRGCWKRLCHEAGKCNLTSDQNETPFTKMVLNKWLSTNATSYFRFLIKLAKNNFDYDSSQMDENESTMLLMFHYDFWQKAGGFDSIHDSIAEIGKNKEMVEEMIEVLEILIDQISFSEIDIQLPYTQPLKLHSRYTRDQILVAFGMNTFDRASSNRIGVGVAENKEINTEILFINLYKSEESFSATTMYDDYAISEQLFHWQSQNSAGPNTPKGLSYIKHKENEKYILLFVREQNKDEHGNTMGYVFIGKGELKEHYGEKPMNIKWALNEPLPTYLWKEAAKLRVG